MLKALYKLIVSVSVLGVVALANPLGTNNVYAYGNCEANYGGGETCILNKSFEVTKKVRIEGDNSWKDKVIGVAIDEIVEFRIRVKNVGEVEVDNMKMEDFLPDEMIFLDNEGLTQEWDNFSPGETQEFKIKARIKDSEFDRENFEKCIVNKVEIDYDGNFEGSDTATVCYGDAEITELPETGPTASIAFSVIGLGLISGGTLVKKKLLASF